MTTEWKLVPVEPTGDQLIRGAECLHDCGVRFEDDDSEPQQDIAESLYRAMLAAAPAAPAMTDAQMEAATISNETADELAQRAYRKGLAEGGAELAAAVREFAAKGSPVPQWAQGAMQTLTDINQSLGLYDERERRAPARREEMAAFAAELKADPAKAQAFFQSAGILNERGELTPQYGGLVQQAEPVEGAVWHDGSVSLIRRGAEDDYCARHPGAHRLYRHPPAAPVAWVDVHDRDEGPYEFHGRKLLDAGAHDLYLHPPAAEVQQAEPVAWRYQDARGHFRYRGYVAGLNSEYAILNPVPLYLHPPAAEVQRLVDALTEIAETSWAPLRLRQIARAALEG